MAEWQNNLFQCFNNPALCVLSYFVPCVPFGRTAETVGESCGLCGCALLVPGLNLYAAAKIRTAVREAKGIEGSCPMDLLFFWFCPFCTVAQMAQEMDGTSPPAMARE